MGSRPKDVSLVVSVSVTCKTYDCIQLIVYVCVEIFLATPCIVVRAVVAVGIAFLGLVFKGAVSVLG
jgi:hypothetical protein